MTSARLLIFARAPVPGATKTRLIPALGASGTARLHAELVRHALAQAAAAQPLELQLWGTGDDPEGVLAAMAAEAGASLHEQPQGGLGERMAYALERATADGTPAIVIGTDCPWLHAGALRDAAAMLASADAVLGPAFDGGYVLLGLHRVRTPLFTGIEWGSDRVLELTRGRMIEAGWHWRELPARPDVDRPEDLEPLAALGPEWARLAKA